MKAIRWALLPFSIIYGTITGLRNWLFNIGWKGSYPIPGKSITVGNLSVGGTGKSPFVMYLIRHFLSEKQSVATLSRGYGRKTKGYILANNEASARTIGDEPLQYHTRFRDKISVNVSEERKIGVDQIRKGQPQKTVILLDDAYQHRKVKAGLNILITEYHRPYSRDFLLPVGRLREVRSGAKRADLIVVSKCPDDLSEQDKAMLSKELAKSNQPVFFSTIQYGKLIPISGVVPETIENVLLVTGIGNSSPLETYLKSKFSVTHVKFPDHHDFTDADILSIHQKFNTFASRDKVIITTEKDFMRLQQLSAISNGTNPWFYQPIEIAIDNDTELKNLLNGYVREN